LHSLSFPFYLKSSSGTAMTVLVDSNDGTVSFLTHYK
jgi:hypothetical protein